MGILFTNNASSTLNGAITNVATSLIVTTGQGTRFPAPGGSDWFYATITDGTNTEIIKCTARSTDTFSTIVRAQDGTTAYAFASGSTVELRPVRQALIDVQTVGTTTPTGITGLLKGASSSIAQATAGTDYVAPGTATTFTAKQTFSGSTAAEGAAFTNASELVNTVAAAPSATTNFYVSAGAVQYYTTSAANNWTLNVAMSAGTSANTAMAVGDSVTIALLTTQGATAYYESAMTIDGGAVTPKWQGGTAPAAGNASSIDVYTYTIAKTASATFTVLAALTQFK